MHRNVKTKISSSFSTLSNKISACTECICNFKSLLHYCTLVKRKKLKTPKVNYIVLILKYDGFKANIIAKIPVLYMFRSFNLLT